MQSLEKILQDETAGLQVCAPELSIKDFWATKAFQLFQGPTKTATKQLCVLWAPQKRKMHLQPRHH